jgi:hypothetical protein
MWTSMINWIDRTALTSAVILAALPVAALVAGSVIH